MNREQRDRAVAVIQEDATATGRLLRADGTQCVQGGLASACGIPDERLLNMAGLLNEDGVLVRETFGLSYLQLNLLMSINDSYMELEWRRTKLIEYIDSLVEVKE